MSSYPQEKPSRLSAVLNGLCPRCRSGAIFRGKFYWGLPAMHERCPVCALKYEREPGYFLGAMMISYGLAVPVMAVFLALLWAATNFSFWTLLLLSFLALLPFAPLLTLFARVLWIHFDRTVDPGE